MAPLGLVAEPKVSEDFWQLVGAMISVATPVMGLALALNRQRKAQMSGLYDRIAAAELRAQRDHKALAKQVQDTNLTIAEHYVPNARLETEIREIHQALVRIDGNVSEAYRRVDRLYQNVQWRPGGSGG
jgi:SMC interacting uncharacterized protein involved in chromosome segregation